MSKEMDVDVVSIYAFNRMARYEESDFVCEDDFDALFSDAEEDTSTSTIKVCHHLKVHHSSDNSVGLIMIIMTQNAVTTGM